MYLEERRRTRSTRGSRASLADELPDDFQVVDTAFGISRQSPDNGTAAEDRPGVVLRGNLHRMALCCTLHRSPHLIGHLTEASPLQNIRKWAPCCWEEHMSWLRILLDGCVECSMQADRNIPITQSPSSTACLKMQELLS